MNCHFLIYAAMPDMNWTEENSG